jgi:protocatechuate 3,4-dioxygenase beta subunit
MVSLRRVAPILAIAAMTRSARGQAASPLPAMLTGTVLDMAQMPMAGAVVELLGLTQTHSG